WHTPVRASVRALGDLVESPGGGLWLRQVGGEFRQVAHSSFEASNALEGRDDPLPAFLRRTGWVLGLADVRVPPERDEHLQLPASISSLRDACMVGPLQPPHSH